MKKNIFLSILALASMLFATSCSQDELINESTNGDFVNATFTIETADGIGTRAVGDGTTVDKVACAVYDAYNNEELESLRQDVAITNKTATFSVRLAKGKNYRVAFFAYNEAANAYDVTDLKSIKVNGNQLSNVEGRDAFTAYVDVTEGETMNAFTKEVTLKRPFAQLNLGIDDAEFAEAANAGLTVAKSKIVVNNVYNAFSAFDNAVAENAVEGSMTFELNAIPTEKLKVTVNGEERLYNYLALNYLLVGDNDTEKTLTDIKFTWESNNGDSNAESVTEFLNIPVQRNYRTNIVGKLLTSPTIFNIIIDEEFEGEKNDGRIFNATDLQAALDAAPANATTVITLGANIEANVTDIQKPGRKVVIDGRGYKYNGTIKVHSNSEHYTDAALTIKNLNFETSTASVNFIEALENGSERYSCNITVENCTFTATGAAVDTAVGVQIKASKNAKVIGCTATNMHSLIQAQSCDESVFVQGCTVTGKNGVAFKQVKNAVVVGTTITATAYGIRFDGNTDNYGITVKDNNVTASQPFIVRKMTGKDNTIALEGTNTLTTGETYQIVITNGSDDETYVEPTGTYTLTGADSFVVYPAIENYDAFIEKISDDTWYDDTKTELAIEDVADFAAFVETANSGNDFEGKTLKLTSDIDLYFKDVTAMADGDPATFRPIGDTQYNGGKPFKGTFDGQGHTIKNLYQNGWDLGYNWDVYGSYGLFGKLENATVKNVVIEGSESYIEGGDVSFIAGSATGTCVFENITIKSGVAATYNNGCGGIIGWSGAGNYTFKNITLGEDVVLGGLWGSFDSSIGGIVGQAEPGATYNFENVKINCRLDVYNDVIAAYKYYNYRMCGMIIGRCAKTVTIDGKNYPDLSQYNLSFNNVEVNFGEWMNYHYCVVEGKTAWRVEPGYAYDGVPADHNHDNCTMHHNLYKPFDVLIGGEQYGVYGHRTLEDYPEVKVTYPASYNPNQD